MAISRQQLAALNKEDLQRVVAMASDILKDRENFRKKELWGNVMAAIAKYEKEIEPINIYCPYCGANYSIDSIESNAPGYLEIG